ncbi:MAG: DUF480 domain-containing protein [Verrucomicrobiota bacterium JB023]|nr:DUF480 domain-containing protein [Verrucomicrobiota bacterium JB023]
MKHFPELTLTPVTARILGCLLEKEEVTPDAYPMTLNGLVTACNQSTSRDPVTSYSSDEVAEGLRLLGEDYLVTKVLGGRSPKYKHNLPDVLDLSSGEKAVFTVLLLRGRQTVGEIKQRTERIYCFDSLSEVEEILSGFIEYPHGPLVERVPAGSGRRVESFRHLLCGEGESIAEEETPSDWKKEMEDRISALEQEVARLRQSL